MLITMNEANKSKSDPCPKINSSTGGYSFFFH